ncbi:cell division protein SepF [Leucobacter sp. CSA1]|uniref:Cell division protein SepF n=1 Tax=Leucobacter chromiisoli TaxID=2796471 RepID=A0A934Q835_9MICO|nr:cell division protein SepF [Leucobacter chromiisoli]MBK0419203.1 cell division protein SepF [Leucobacter chromiisoli]
MSNPLKKTMVFLGLAEEDLENQSSANAAPATSASEPAAAPVRPAESSRPAQQKAPVTPLRKVTPTRHTPAQAMNEILTVHPREYRDATLIAESFRDGVPVILNLSQMNEADAKRLIDFASGLSMGLRGRIERVTSKVFLLSPENIAVSGEEQQKNESGSFFVSPSA